jgi:hypothetical protein
MLRVVSTQRSWRRSPQDILRAISNHSSGGSFLELDVIVLGARQLGRGCCKLEVSPSDEAHNRGETPRNSYIVPSS